MNPQNDILGITLSNAPKGWILGFAASFVLFLVFMFAAIWLFAYGVGIWGIGIPVAWGFAIVNFVWWIGIAHAGTFISAILLLLNQDWRKSVSRFAEAMTLFALACAGLFPIFHLGRPEFFYWLIPYPNSADIWPQFRSPLVWDLIAVLTYTTISVLFWYVGLIPDLAALRDKANSKSKKRVYGLFALGWSNERRQWHRHRSLTIFLAALATPLVVSVHSIVSLDFSVAILPGWHTTIFPPYFVAGAIYSGFAMVFTIGIPVRKFYKLHDYITAEHLDRIAQVLLVTGLFVTYGYVCENFLRWYSGSEFERSLLHSHALGKHAVTFWTMLTLNAALPNIFWFRAMRRNAVVLFVSATLINVGMWIERYVIVTASLEHGFLPPSWGDYSATVWDWLLLLGSFGLFLSLLFLFVRFIPVVSVFEMKEKLAEERQ